MSAPEGAETSAPELCTTKARLVDRYIIVLYLLIVKTNKNK
nr:MAG TPA: hypothetical protein [Caudoviricetes sp.]